MKFAPCSWLGSLLLLFAVSASAQLMPKSSLVLEVKPASQGSGAKVGARAFYFEQRNYVSGFVLDVSIRNMNKDPVKFDLEWYYTAKPMAGGRTFVFEHGSKPVELAGGAFFSEPLVSEVVEGSKVRGYFPRETGRKKDGWILRIKENGVLTRWKASTPSLEAIGGDPAALAALLKVPKK